MRTSEHIGALVEALAKARPLFKTILKNQKNPAFGNQPYADQSDIIDAVYVALSEHGLILTGGTEPLEDGGIEITSRLTHISEQYIENAIRLQRADWEVTNQKGNRLQLLGGAITYAWRYTTGPLLGVAAEKDEDGQGLGDAAKMGREQSRPAKTVARAESPEPMSTPSQTSGVSAPASETAADHPTQVQIDSLKELARSTDHDLSTWVAQIRVAMGKPQLKEATDRFLVSQMTMAQYAAVEAQYAAAIRDAVDAESQAVVEPSRDPEADEVPDFAGEPDTIPDPDAEAHLAAIRGEGREGVKDAKALDGEPEPIPAAPEPSPGYATAAQREDLSKLAEKVGPKAANDLQEVFRTHRPGLKLSLYKEIRDSLLGQEAQAAQVEG